MRGRQDFAAQCEALLSAKPPIVSSVMGVFPSQFVARLKRAGIAWFASVSTVAEAQAAEAAGADAIVAQGMEAAGHRGCFDAGSRLMVDILSPGTSGSRTCSATERTMAGV